MLQILHIENIAVIEKADVEFGPGMNVLTGETGAGKSMVIDALGAVLGMRTSKDIVRAGSDGALITAVFDSGAAAAWCRENGITAEGDEVFLMRRINPDGKNTCRINGNPVSVSQLREAGELLLDIHGQNDGQRLTDEKNHRAYLDGFGKTGAEREEYLKAYRRYLSVKKDIEALSMDESEKERRIDTLKAQISELESADIKPGEIEEKTKLRDLMKNSGKLVETLNEAFYAMYGGERSDGAIALITEAERMAEFGTRFSAELEGVHKKLTDLRYAAQDAAEELRDLKNGMDFSPADMDALDGRLDVLRRISRKYGGTEEEMLEHLQKCRTELDGIEYSEDRLKRLEAELEKEHSTARRAAEQLSERRQTAAKALQRRIQSELGQLSMPGVRFEVRFEKTRDLNSFGLDEVRFLMSANAGEEPGRISQIASGGELARIMLAMKNVLAEDDEIETMVFDEVDTGVSGVAAQRVGEKLAQLSSAKQVICVTHLPQIAAMADAHFVIEKEETGGRTYTHITRLNIDGRKNELARLIGGENITPITLSSAGEQLEAAERFKKQ